MYSSCYICNQVSIIVESKIDKIRSCSVSGLKSSPDFRFFSPRTFHLHVLGTSCQIISPRMTATPSIACIGIIGKHVSHSVQLVSRRTTTDPDTPPHQDNPLHISVFPSHNSTPRAHLEYSFLLNASLDIFDLRSRDRNRVDQDLGLLQIIDERLSIWGWETGTGARFAIVIDAWGGDGVEGRGAKGGGKGLADGDVRGVCSPIHHR